LGRSSEQQLRARFQRALASASRSSSLGHEVDPRPTYRFLARQGLLAPHVPTRFGGLGLDLRHTAMLLEEMVDAGVPENLYVLSHLYAAQTIRIGGNEAAQRRFLPQMARGELYANILYTEPHAGSDLAKLSTNLLDGRLNGVKVYGMKAHQCQYAVVAARTRQGKYDHDGISLLVIPYDATGVNVEILDGLSFEPFNRVTFRSADIGLETGRAVFLGERDHGWELLIQVLSLERSGLDYYLKARRWLRIVTELDGLHTPCERAKFATRLEECRVLVFRLLDELSTGHFDQARTAASKFLAAELAKDIVQVGVGRLDPTAAPSRYQEFEAAFREAPGVTLSGGSNEMLLETIARTQFGGMNHATS
jgi:alkylation response protein AidB-like acyl-CoA dehydrogenase